MRRRSFEKVNLKIVAMVALLIFFLMISVGYSMLRQKLNIYGRSTIVVNENNNNINTNEKGEYKQEWIKKIEQLQYMC